jgi:aminopeptidase N
MPQRALIALSLLLSLGAAPPPTPPTLRLPAGAAPAHYALDLTIVPAADSFSGVVTIDLKLSEKMSVLWLNASGLDIERATLRTGGETLAARVVPGGEDFVGFQPPREVGPGPAQLVVKYRGKLDAERSRGLYRVSEGAGADDWYAYTFFESIDARRAFPCFDEPSYKVQWDLTFHVKKGHLALANSPVASETPEPNGMKKVVMKTSKPLPSYLVAFVVGPFDLVDGGKAGRKPTAIRFIVPRGRGGETRYAKEVTPKLVQLLEGYFDMTYPYEKLDVAVVPRFWGTMEHPGIVALGQPLTLIKPSEESLSRKQNYANIAVHELAHYWFGDYVTCAWWDDVWLNESFGEWLDTKLTDQLEPSWKWALTHENGQAQMAMSTDSLATVQKVRSTVETRDAIENAFDNSITYSKGASLLRMVESWIGKDKLRAVIQRYLAAHAWGNARSVDFIKELRDGAGDQVAAAFASFVDQPGVPLLTAKASCEGGAAKLTISQKRFLAAGGDAGKQRWAIPVCVRAGDATGGEEKKCAIVSEPATTLPLERCPAWILPNAGAAGYFRAAYDGASLRALLPVFAAKLDVRERVRVGSDVSAQAEQGSLPLGDALTLLPALLGDPDLRPFRGGVGMLGLMHADEQPAAQQKAYGRLVQKLLLPKARAAGWAPKDGEDPAMTQVRPMLWRISARWVDDKDDNAEARRLADAWLADRKAVAPDMAETVVDLAARHGDAAFFDKLLAEAKKTSDRRERGQMLSSLGMFLDGKLLERALALTLAPDLDLRETLRVLEGALFEPRTREATWTFLKANWESIVGRMRADDAMGLVREIPHAFCDEAHRKDITAFFATRAQKLPGAAHVLANSLETTDVCIAAVKRGRPAVEKLLGAY